MMLLEKDKSNSPAYLLEVEHVLNELNYQLQAKHQLLKLQLLNKLKPQHKRLLNHPRRLKNQKKILIWEVSLIEQILFHIQYNNKLIKFFYFFPPSINLKAFIQDLQQKILYKAILIFYFLIFLKFIKLFLKLLQFHLTNKVFIQYLYFNRLLIMI